MSPKRMSPTMMPEQQRSLSTRAVASLAAGTIGGLAAWLLVEKTGWFDLVLYGAGSLAPGTHRLALQIALGGVYGFCVGAALSAPTRGKDAGAAQVIARVLIAAALGAIGGCLGIWAGQVVYDRLLAHADARDVITVALTARCLGWGIIGLVLGAAQSVIRSPGRSILLHAFGGCCGGVAGGAMFEALEPASNPSLARLIGFMFVGAAIGFLPEAIPLLAGRKARANFTATKAYSMNSLEDSYNPAPDSPFASEPVPIAHSDAPLRQPAQLVGVEGPYSGIIFPLRDAKSDIVIGRLTDCDVCLMNDRTISRRHALLRRDEATGWFRLEDLRSANGTGINSARLRPNQAQLLTMRDLIHLGASTLRFEWLGNPPAPQE